MDLGIKLSYIIRLLKTSRDTEIPPTEALYSAANAYKLTEPSYISKLIQRSNLTYDSAIAVLSEIKLGLGN